MIDKRLLVDTVKVKILKAKNEWGKELYDEPFELYPVRFDRGVSISSRYSKNTTRSHSGVIYIYPDHVKKKLNYEWLSAIIIDEDREYKVVGFQMNMHPFKNEVFSYELEVV